LLGTSFELATTGFAEEDGSFMPLRRLPLERGGRLVVYQTNCGATCSFGVVVRHERVLMPGVLLLVRNVFSRYGWDDARVEVTAPDRAIMEGSEVRLRRWVYL
jgi:hypothetical protein